MGGIDLFLLRDRRDFLVVACLYFFGRRGIDHVLAEVGVVQFAIADIGHALLVILGVTKTFGGSTACQKLHVDCAGKGRNLLLFFGKLSQLRVEVLDRDVEFGLSDVQAAHLGDDRIVSGESRGLDEDRSGNSSRYEKFVAQHRVTFRLVNRIQNVWHRPENLHKHRIVAILYRPSPLT